MGWMIKNYTRPMVVAFLILIAIERMVLELVPLMGGGLFFFLLRCGVMVEMIRRFPGHQLGRRNYLVLARQAVTIQVLVSIPVYAMLGPTPFFAFLGTLAEDAWVNGLWRILGVAVIAGLYVVACEWGYRVIVAKLCAHNLPMPKIHKKHPDQE